MTAASVGPSAEPPVAPSSSGRQSPIWRVGFRIMYRFLRLIDPLIRSWIAHGFGGLDGVVEVRIPGRRTGETRATLVTILRVGETWYIGHPNGDSAWTRNAEAAGTVTIDPPAARGDAFAIVRLEPGAERDAVIKATHRQQPFPANLVYRAAFRHITAVGVYFRLVPATAAP